MALNLRKLTAGVALGAALIVGAGAVTHAQDAKHSIVTVVKLSGIAWFNRMEEGVKEYAA